MRKKLVEALMQVFMSSAAVMPLGRAPLQAPSYWTEECKAGQLGQKLVPGTSEELGWMQEILDETFKNKVRSMKSWAKAKLAFTCCLLVSQDDV